MELRLLNYLANIKEFNGASLSATLKCTCGATEFAFSHTGKQTKGILAPFIVRRKGQLIVKANCSCCHSSVTVYDSTQDGTRACNTPQIHEFVPFAPKSLPNRLSVAIKYNYFPEKLKIGEKYSNQFENCLIYIIDEKGKEGKALIEE